MKYKYPAIYYFVLCLVTIVLIYFKIYFLAGVSILFLLYETIKTSKSKYFVLLWLIILCRFFLIMHEHNKNIEYYSKQNSFIGIVEETTRYDYNKCLVKINSPSLFSPSYYIEVRTNDFSIKENMIISITGNVNKYDKKRTFRGRNIYREKSNLNIIGFIDCKNIKVLNQRNGIREKILNLTYKRIEELPLNIKAFASKILVNKSIDLDSNKLFKDLGMAHLLAISGLHIGILIKGLKIILNKFISSNLIENLLIILILYFYLMLISFPISAVRAVVFYIIYVCSKIFLRKYNFINCIFATACIFICLNPMIIFDLSFQLSFSAVLGIALFYKSIYNLFNIKNSKVKSIISMTISAQIFLIPIQMLYFGYVNFLNIVANIVFVPLFIPIIFLILIIWPLYLILPNIFIYFYILLDFIYYSLYELLKVSLYINEFKISCTKPYIIQIVLYFFILIYYQLNERRILFRRLCFVFLSYVFIIFIPTTQIWVSFIDVAQGDSVFVELYNNNFFIDTGGNKLLAKNHYNKYIYNFMKTHDIVEIHNVYISHYDIDHIGNLEYLINDYNVYNIITAEKPPYKNLKEFIPLYNGKIYSMKKGIKHTFDKRANIKAVWPKDYIDGNVGNEETLVQILNINNNKILFTGDIGLSENELFSDNIDIDILKVGHHGSKHSTSNDFLNKIKCKYAIISVGKNNYGHPSDEVIERLEKKQYKILRTDIDGEISIRMDCGIKIFKISDKDHYKYYIEKIKEPYLITYMLVILALWYFIIKKDRKGDNNELF